MKLYSIVMTLLGIMILSGCTSTDLAEGPPVFDYKPEIYRLGVGDGVSVSVWKNPELSVGVPVRPDGKISVPLVGDIQAAGESPEGLAKRLEAKLSNYIRNPKVTVIVTQANSAEFLARVRLTGAVSHPMSVEYKEGMTVLDLVLAAGGPTPFASQNKARLYRQTERGRVVYPVYLEDILEKGDLTTNYRLMPSDIITVPESAF